MPRMEGIITYRSKLYAASVFDRLITLGWLDARGWLTDPATGYCIDHVMSIKDRQLVVPDYEYPFSEDTIIDPGMYHGWLISTTDDQSRVYLGSRRSITIKHSAWNKLEYSQIFSSPHEGISQYVKQLCLLDLWKRIKPDSTAERNKRYRIKKFIRRVKHALTAAEC